MTSHKSEANGQNQLAVTKLENLVNPFAKTGFLLNFGQKFVCDVCLAKAEPNKTRLMLGGDITDYLIDYYRVLMQICC